MHEQKLLQNLALASQLSSSWNIRDLSIKVGCSPVEMQQSLQLWLPRCDQEDVLRDGRIVFAYPWYLLDIEMLAQCLDPAVNTYEYFYNLPSTQDFLVAKVGQYLAKDALLVPPVQWCFAEYQSKARGQYERRWHAPFASGVYLSAMLLVQQHRDWSGFAYVIAKAVMDDLIQQYPDLNFSLKAPNDIYCSGRKIAGVLVQMYSQGDRHVLICGVGLNVNSVAAVAWTSLSEQCGCFLPRATIAVRMATVLSQQFSKLSLDS